MAEIVALPKFGQTEQEATLVKWRKKEGDTVRKGEILFEVETDKAVLEVESFHEGTLLKIVVREGETVPIAAPVAVIGQPGEPIPPLPRVSRVPPPETGTARSPGAGPQTKVAAPPLSDDRSEGTPAPAAAPLLEPRRLTISPRARALARDCAVTPENIQGTGPGGRIVEKDVRAYLAARGYGQLRISPAAKALAARESVDITTVEPSGAGRRLMRRDVERAVAEKPKPLSRIRQVIAKRMTQSCTTIPHFFATVSADVTDILALITKSKARKQPWSLNDFVLKSAVLALQKYPAVNSTTDGRTVRWHSHVHLGMAVSITDGLVVPVIRKAEEMSLSELRTEARTLASKARQRTLTPEEMTGGTFTISNRGMLDVENFTAIINPGESAILAVGSAKETPTAVKGRVKVRSLMKMTLSSDHRIIDGVAAARFVNEVKSRLEDMKLWKSMTLS